MRAAEGFLSAFSTRFRSDASDLKNRKQFESEEFFISNFSRATINRVFSSNFKGFLCLAEVFSVSVEFRYVSESRLGSLFFMEMQPRRVPWPANNFLLSGRV
jgi:hypothetical protein